MAEDSGAVGIDKIAPYTNAKAVTKSDSTLLDPIPRGLYIGGAGAVVVDMQGGQVDITFAAVPVGTILDIRPTKVKAATAATNILALW